MIAPNAGRRRSPLALAGTIGLVFAASPGVVACADDGDQGSATTTTAVPGPDFGTIEEEFSGEGPAVVILGDSLVVAVRDRLHQALDGDFSTKIGALTGEGFAGGAFSATLDTDVPAMQDAAARYAEDAPDIVVLALGTNDAWLTELALDDSIAGLHEMAGRFPDACMVVVQLNTFSTAPGYDVDEAAAINDVLADVADVVVPGLAPDQTEGDEIHPNPAGREALASSIAGGVSECRS